MTVPPSVPGPVGPSVAPTDPHSGMDSQLKPQAPHFPSLPFRSEQFSPKPLMWHRALLCLQFKDRRGLRTAWGQQGPWERGLGEGCRSPHGVGRVVRAWLGWQHVRMAGQVTQEVRVQARGPWPGGLTSRNILQNSWNKIYRSTEAVEIKEKWRNCPRKRPKGSDNSGQRVVLNGSFGSERHYQASW